MPQEKIIKDKKFLICDDDKAVAGFLEQFLRQEGHSHIDIVTSGEGALKKISQNKYDLVLLDIKLPGGMDGIQTLKRIKEADNTLSVVMITGFPEIQSAEEAVRLGAYDYIVKPFDLAYLKLVVLTKIFLDSK